MYGLQYRGMALSRSRRSSGGASLAVAAILLCLGAFLSWAEAAPDVPVSPSVGHSSHVDRGSSGHQADGSYLAGPAEEADDGDKSPVNADLLTALLLAFFFGVAVGSPLVKARGYDAFWSSGVVHRPSFVVRQHPASLGVFRL
jgi:hypothetical protein